MTVSKEDLRFAMETAKQNPHLVLVYSRLNDWYERKCSFDVLETDQIIFDPESLNGAILTLACKGYDMSVHVEALISFAFVKLLEDMMGVEV